MRKLSVTIALLVAMLLGMASSAAAQVSVDIRIGPPPPPRIVHVVPPRPGVEFMWIDGYWYPSGSRYLWRDGYWSRAPYVGAYWVVPRYEGGRYYKGHWAGKPGKVIKENPGKGRGRGRGRGR